MLAQIKSLLCLCNAAKENSVLPLFKSILGFSQKFNSFHNVGELAWDKDGDLGVFYGVEFVPEGFDHFRVEVEEVFVFIFVESRGLGIGEKVVWNLMPESKA
jgi:hypothetical protein